MRVGVLTAGGDCPGLNAVIRAVVRKAERHYGDSVVGFHDGFRGVIENDWTELDVERCRGILPRGGTILGTSRVEPYSEHDGVERVRLTMSELGVDALIAVGGDGSLGAARDLADDGVPIVGVPKTIDNDIDATEMTFGFDTAVQIATDAIDRLHTTAESHDRVMVVEVMGRHAGHIAIRAGLAGGASLTLIPEHPFDIEAVCESIFRRHRRAKKYATIIVVAEGAEPVAGTLDLAPKERDRFGHVRLGGIAQVVADEVEHRTGYETRVTILGHVQRGGTPTSFDRVLASRYGVAAIDAVHDAAFGQMVALDADRIVRVDLHEATGTLKMVSDELYDAASQFFS
ncbi:MAG: ATP-dependent 6-phosphofructokinase [Acidimicrobiales bacterium]|nr:ATP-dependent 6-phosphofructokinase [Acidimicrobiales bacterium]